MLKTELLSTVLALRSEYCDSERREKGYKMSLSALSSHRIVRRQSR